MMRTWREGEIRGKERNKDLRCLSQSFLSPSFPPPSAFSSSYKSKSLPKMKRHGISGWTSVVMHIMFYLRLLFCFVFWFSFLPSFLPPFSLLPYGTTRRGSCSEVSATETAREKNDGGSRGPREAERAARKRRPWEEWW